jgi:tetratricopeptide (TPR) repeat protein
MQGTTQKDHPDTLAALDGLTPEELLSQGSQQFRAKEYAKARLCFERYIDAAPSDPSALHLLARVYYHENDNLDKACELLDTALRLDPEGAARYLQTMAEVRIHQGEFDLAGDALAAAREADTGDDTKLTYAIDFYLNLISRKTSGRKKRARQEAEPEYYSARTDTRYNRKGRHLFVLPSILLHVAVVLLLGYLSGYNLHSKQEHAEDFTFVEVAPVAETGAAAKGGTGGTRGAPGRQATGQVAPAPGGPERGISTPAAIKEQLGLPSEGPRTLASEKAFTGLEKTEQFDESAPRESVAQKNADLRARAQSFDEADVRFRPGGLGISGASRQSGKMAEPGIGSLSDRVASPATAVPGALSAKTASGGGRERLATGGKAAATLERAGPADETGHAGAPSVSEEKTADIVRARPMETGAKPADMMSRSNPDAIYIGPSVATAVQGPQGKQSLGTVKRGAAAVKAQGMPAGLAPASSVNTGKDSGPGILTAKADTGALGAIGGGPGESTQAPMPSSSPVREPGFSGVRPGKGFSPAEAAPAPRGSLGITAGAPGKAAATGSAGTRGGTIAGITDKGTGTAPARGAIGRPGIEAAGSESGYTAGGGTGSGKGMSAAALEGGTADSFQADFSGAVSGPGKVGISGRPGTTGGSLLTAGEGPRGAGSLEGLAGKASGGAAKGRTRGQGGGGEGQGLTPGIGEKTGTAAPGGTKIAGVVGTGTFKEAGPAGKKDADGALGVPGGEGQGRYASLSKTSPAPIAPVKMPGVRAVSKGVTGGFGPTVRLLTPGPGSTSEMAQVVSGTVSDHNVRKATLTINNDSKVISVTDGKFEAAVGLTEGKNVITVMAFDKDGNPGKDSVTVNFRLSSGPVPVAITEPKDGQIFDVSQSNIIKVRGTVGDPSVKKAQMILNGRPKDIVVKDGRFSQEVAITQEKNTVAVEVEDQDGVSTSELVGFGTMNIKPKDIMVILTWDKPNADFDLHVYGPLGGHTYYKSPNIYESTDAIPGGQLEQDAKSNYGPEVFTMEHAEKGVYTIKSNYYYSGGDGDADATVTIVLYGDNPARRIVRVFGPHLQVDKKTGEDMWDVARFKMPEGIFLED